MSESRRLLALREGDRADLVTGLSVLVGVLLGAVHPVGLAVGGLLVGLVAPTPARAVVLGVYLGGVALAAVAVLSGTMWPALPPAVSVAGALAVPSLVAAAVRAAV